MSILESGRAYYRAHPDELPILLMSTAALMVSISTSLIVCKLYFL